MTRVEPILDRVLVKPDQAEEKTKSGLYLPESAREDLQQGVVVSIGPGRINKKGVKIMPEVKDGDRVIYDQYAQTTILVGDEEYIVCPPAAILAILG